MPAIFDAMKYTYDAYAADVLAGKINVCRLTRLAVLRHANDLKSGQARGLSFDDSAARHAIDFFDWLKHSKGEWAGETLRLEPWQQFQIAMLFGWRKSDGARRYRTGYLEVARKNGKSTLLAGVGLYLMLGDGEPGAEVYTAATKRDQARITHSEATRMVKSSPALRKHVTAHKDNLHIAGTASKFEPLGRDSDTMDGLNVHGAIIDEFHAHPTRDTFDLLNTATGSRRQPLIVIITTAGHDRHTVCYEFHEYAFKVLNGVIDDDAFYCCVYALDEATDTEPADDWEIEDNWIKANPNLGVSKKLESMRAAAKTAMEMPSALNSFLRLELNVWTQSSTRWVMPERWLTNGGAVDANGLRGRVCYGGLDCASTLDIAAFILAFPPAKAGEPASVLCRFWVPDEAIRERSKRDRVPYDVWLRAGFIVATPGAVIDYAYIKQQILDDASIYDMRELAYDPWNATQLINELAAEDVTTLVQFRQGYASMSPAMKALGTAIAAGMLAHGNNPVLAWMAANLVATEDPAGNIKPDKSKSSEKIDGMVGLIMAHGRATLHGDSGSVYENRGVLTL